MTIRAGQLRHRIDIIRKTTGQDANGFETEIHTVHLASIPAAFRPLTANERAAASQRQSESTAEFEIRAGLDIRPDDLIRFNGRLWNIDPPLRDATLKISDRIQAADPESIQGIEIT